MTTGAGHLRRGAIKLPTQVEAGSHLKMTKIDVRRGVGLGTSVLRNSASCVDVVLDRVVSSALLAPPLRNCGCG